MFMDDNKGSEPQGRIEAANDHCHYLGIHIEISLIGVNKNKVYEASITKQVKDNTTRTSYKNGTKSKQQKTSQY